MNEDPKSPNAERAWNLLMLSVGFGVALGIFIWEGGFRGYDRTPGLVLGTLVGTIVIAAVVVYVGYARRQAVVGPALVAFVVGTPIALFAWKLGFSSLFAGATRAWPSKPGFRCLALSTVDGLSILAALIATRRNRVLTHPIAAGASMGVAAGALAWVLVDLWCPVGQPEHVLLGHVVPLLILTAVGAWPGGLVLQARRRK